MTLSALGLVVLVSCTTISVAAPAEPIRGERVGIPGAAGPSGSPTAGAATPTLAARPTDEPVESPTAAPTPARSVPVVTPLVTAAPTPTSTPEPTLAATPTAATALPGDPSPGSIISELPTPSATPAGPLRSLDRRARRKIKQVVGNWVSKKGVAGLSVAVGLKGGTVWTDVAGHAELTPRRKVEDDTVFAVASVTKTFTAALILALAEEGRLSLDEPFGTYMADAPRSRTVTVRQLLSHTSGIHNYFESPKYLRVFRDREHRWTYEEIIDLVKPGYCKPGRCYHYSNTNYVILGRLAEVVGGAPLHEQLRTRFFEPLGMRDTIYQPADPTPLDAAHGHWPLASGGHIDHTRTSRVIPFMAAASVASSAGAIASTASDLAIWARALYGGRVISRASLREMTSSYSEGSYGLGTDFALFAGKRAVGHRGGLRGFESSMWYFPSEDVSIVLLSNQGNWLTDVPFSRIAKAVFRGR